jgi:hypothetical protein
VVAVVNKNTILTKKRKSSKKKRKSTTYKIFQRTFNNIVN